MVSELSQPARNTPGRFAECSLSVAMFSGAMFSGAMFSGAMLSGAMFRTSREHLGNILKEKVYKKFWMQKLFLC